MASIPTVDLQPEPPSVDTGIEVPIRSFTTLIVSGLNTTISSTPPPSNTTTTVASTKSTTSSLPATNTSTALSTNAIETGASSLSTAAKAGIGAGIGVAVLLVVALTTFYTRLRQRRSKPADRYVAEVEKSGKAGAAAKESSDEIRPKAPIVTYPKPELEGSQGTSRFTSSSKPELSATASVVRGLHATPAASLPAAGQRAVPANHKSHTEKEVTAAERQTPILPQATGASGALDRNDRLTSPQSSGSRSEDLSPKYLAGEEGAVRVTSREYCGQDAGPAFPHAQEDSPVTIDALKAEHAALAERIRQIEIREQQRRRENDPRTCDAGGSAL